jgi:DNA invertase Pin-like site-specific DNA recombinase
LRNRVYGYARLSSLDQNAGPQLDALTAAGCDRIVTDQSSGKLAGRPQRDELMDRLASQRR